MFPSQHIADPDHFGESQSSPNHFPKEPVDLNAFSNPNTPSKEYRKSRPTPLAIPAVPVSNHTTLTAEFDQFTTGPPHLGPPQMQSAPPRIVDHSRQFGVHPDHPQGAQPAVHSVNSLHRMQHGVSYHPQNIQNVQNMQNIQNVRNVPAHAAGYQLHPHSALPTVTMGDRFGGFQGNMPIYHHRAAQSGAHSVHQIHPHQALQPAMGQH